MVAKSRIETPTCLYCGSSGPFSDEHVICAGLGGDDKRFLLKDTVCARCNTTVFTPLEREFMRSSPIAIARSFMQPSGRKRGKETSPPRVDAQIKQMVNKNGYLNEIDFGQHAKPIILPQLTMIGDKEFASTAECIEDLTKFVSCLTGLLTSSPLPCVRKLSNATEYPFEVFTLSYSDGQYTRSSTSQRLAKPPSNALWIEDASAQADRTNPPPANIFRTLRGQIVLKLGNTTVEQAVEFYRLACEQIQVEKCTDGTVINPLVSVRMTMRIGVMERVMAKIGLNIAAHYLGDAYVRHPAFDAVKAAILTGNPTLHLLPADHAGAIAIFNHLPANQHVFALSTLYTPEGKHVLVMMSRIYGVSTFIDLGIDVPEAPASMPFFATVEYTEHHIRMWSLTEFATFLTHNS
ncbi:hypothetical protein [Pseudomonas putida]|uniref:hypothetical protein n=1 Tax=Pseudomonas putida TaxID=303 RepID=UPI0039E0BA2C